MSENTVMMNTAPTLQRVMRMKSILVGLLAVFALTGCGVGMDDIEGQQAAPSKTTSQLKAATSDNSVSAQGEMRAPINQDPRVLLPQDPIPDYQGMPTGPAAPRPTKSPKRYQTATLCNL